MRFTEYRGTLTVDGVDIPEPAPRCPEAGGSHHDRAGCLVCELRHQMVRATVRDVLERADAAEVRSMRVSGGHLLDLPPVAPIWGTEEELLVAQGQAWMIAGPDGTGKTTLAAQYAKSRLGLLPPEMWHLPVAPLPGGQSVYYIGADRPRQMMEAFRRGLTEEMRPMLDRRLFIHPGPPPYRLTHSSGHEWMLREVEETNAGLVVFDSRKDFGNILDGAEVLGVATMVNLLVAADVDVLILAHPNERRRKGPPDLTAISGLGGVYHGMGSVLFLDGKPGDAGITVHHLKPIRERLPAFRVLHDHATGISERLVEGIVPGEQDGDLVEGRMPSDRWEVRVLQAIDAHPSGEVPASSLKEVLGTDNLSRDLAGLIRRKVIEHNGLRGPQSAYRRGPEAPPR